jgi:polysaccharide biosynthesis/export protein VpsN
MKKAGLFFVLLITFVLAGCASRPVRMTGEEDSVVVGLYKLRSMDPVVINLLGIPLEKQIETVIDEKGNLTIPYIDDPVTARGLTTSELERKIQRIYTDGKIYRNITVNVITTAKIYYMEGEVVRPQEYPLSRRTTLLQAIAAASGYTEYANESKVTITRNGQLLKYDAKYLEKHPEEDPLVEAGDRIKIHRSIF